MDSDNKAFFALTNMISEDLLHQEIYDLKEGDASIFEIAKLTKASVLKVVRHLTGSCTELHHAGLAHFSEETYIAAYFAVTGKKPSFIPYLKLEDGSVKSLSIGSASRMFSD